jgi:TfoX/Sxy family transcriptional regulator of competence genes
MAYNEELADKVRASLSHLPKVEEKKMFRGITFMVDGKMCISVGANELMCRIDPDVFEIAIERNGCRPMIHGKRTMKGFVFVSEEGHSRKKDFDYWIGLALDYNKKAKPARKKK